MLKVQGLKKGENDLIQRIKALGPALVLSPLAMLIIHMVCYIAGFSAFLALVASAFYIAAAIPVKTGKEGLLDISETESSLKGQQLRSKGTSSMLLENYLSQYLLGNEGIITPGSYRNAEEIRSFMQLVCNEEDKDSSLLYTLASDKLLHKYNLQSVISQQGELMDTGNNDTVNYCQQDEMPTEETGMKTTIITSANQNKEPGMQDDDFPVNKSDSQDQALIFTDSLKEEESDLLVDEQKMQASIRAMETTLANTLIESFDSKRINEIVKEQITHVKRAMKKEQDVLTGIKTVENEGKQELFYEERKGAKDLEKAKTEK
ncbi:MAG: hypothetical protein ACFFD4_03935 [Candidatus Odinarchaeota archaeon]